MLKVTVEVMPYGDDTGRKTLATMYVVNSGTGNEETGNYLVSLKEHDSGLVTHMADIIGYQRSRGATELVRQALNALPQRH